MVKKGQRVARFSTDGLHGSRRLRNDLLKNRIDCGGRAAEQRRPYSSRHSAVSINLRQSCLMDTVEAITNGC